MKKKRNFAALIPAAALLLLLGISPLFAAAEQDTTASGGPHTKENGEKYRFSFVDYDEYMPASRQFYYILTGLEESGWIAEGSLPFTIADVEAQHFSTAQMYAALEQADLGPFIAFAEGAFHYMGYEDKEDISSDLKSRAGKDIDLVIAFGTVPGVFVKNLDLPIPMTDFSATDPVASGIIDSATTGSGNPNVWAQVEPSLPMRQLKYYHLVRPFSKLGVVIYGDEIISGVPDIEASAREIGFELVKYNIAMQPRETAEEQDQYYELVGQQIRSIAGEGIDAFFLTVDLINDLSRMQDLLNPLYDRRIPVYLMDDVDALRHGALMLINANDYVNVGRFVADAIGQILDGAEAGSLPCVYASAPGIYVNYDVAKRIGYTLNFEFLTVCDEIYTEGGLR